MSKDSHVSNDLAKRIHSLEAERTKLKKELENLQKDVEQRTYLKKEKTETQATTPALRIDIANIQEQPLDEIHQPLYQAEEAKKKSILYVQSKNEGKRKVVQMDNALNKVIIEELENLLRENDRETET